MSTNDLLNYYDLWIKFSVFWLVEKIPLKQVDKGATSFALHKPDNSRQK